MPSEHTGHRARMRERFAAQGLDGFAPHEILELILFYAIPQRNVNPLAHRLLERFGSLHAVLEAPHSELQKVEGMGEYAASLLRLFYETSLQLQKSRAGDKEQLNTRTSAEAHCSRLLLGKRTEHVYAVCLDASLRVLGDSMIASGTLTDVPAYPRLIAEAVLRFNAHSVILCHNHPGGTPEPSAQDIALTHELWRFLSGIDVQLLDNIIIGDDGAACSLAATGLLQKDDPLSSGPHSQGPLTHKEEQ